MKRIVTLLAFALLLGACDHLCGKDHEHKYSKKRRSAEPYWPVKVCSLGDQTGESCVEYKAKKIIMEHAFSSSTTWMAICYSTTTQAGPS